MKLLSKLLLVMLVLVITSALSFAGEKEEVNLSIAYLQEHLKVLQLDFERTQIELKKAIAKKQELEKEKKDEKTD